jgi:uncharacterized membrane protein YhaH (DUF805 family)
MMLSFLFSFNGRIGRGPYWLGTIGVNLLNWLVVFASAMATQATSTADKNPVAALSALSSQLAITLPLSLAVTWSLFALQVKRFHDRGQSGWWTLLPLAPIVLLVMNIVTAVAENWPPEQLLGSLGWPFLALIVISLGMFINLGCLPGTTGPNKYGDPPGGGFTSPTPAPQAPDGRSPAKPSAAFLESAEKAMDRAIAEAARQPQAPRPGAPARHATPMAQPALARAPVGTPTFGRRPTR